MTLRERRESRMLPTNHMKEGEMKISINQDVSMLDRVKIQAQVLVPVIEAFRKEIGTQRANEILSNALQDWSRKLYH